MYTLSSTRRRPWLAALLSLLMPGLGQLYCGAFARCLFFLIASSGTGLFGVLALIPGLQISGTIIVAAEALSLAMYIFSTADAFRLARRAPVNFPLKDYNRWYSYAMLYVAVAAGHLFSILYARDHLVQPFKAGSASMYPTIWAGDQEFAAKNAYKNKVPSPGDIVIFYNPADRSQVFVKRVVAVGGETVEIRDDNVFINGAMLERDPVAQSPEAAPTAMHGTYYIENNRGVHYRIFLSGAHPKLHDIPKTVVPPHTCYVLGDNRDESLDSRSFGPVTDISVIGKVGYTYAPLKRMGTIK